jgi:ubiquinone/menaquinone biosynthesis C-methylase UbiE
VELSSNVQPGKCDRRTGPDQNVREFQSRFLTREQAERYRDRYISGRRASVHCREQVALAQLLTSVPRVDTALDIPCGTGRLSSILAEAARQIILADGSSAMLEVAREDHPQLNARYLLSCAEKIDLPDNSVEIVFCHRLFHHLRQRTPRNKILAELVRVSGRFVIISYFPASFRTRFRWFLRRLLVQDDGEAGPLSMRAFFDETRAAGLRHVRSTTIRRFPSAGFSLFEKTRCDETFAALNGT